jgi:hypothetical protein
MLLFDRTPLKASFKMKVGINGDPPYKIDGKIYTCTGDHGVSVHLGKNCQL